MAGNTAGPLFCPHPPARLVFESDLHSDVRAARLVPEEIQFLDDRRFWEVSISTPSMLA